MYVIDYKSLVYYLKLEEDCVILRIPTKLTIKIL